MAGASLRMLFLLCILFTSYFSFSQDIITKVDGTKIYGKIIKEDSTNVYIAPTGIYVTF